MYTCINVCMNLLIQINFYNSKKKKIKNISIKNKNLKRKEVSLINLG